MIEILRHGKPELNLGPYRTFICTRCECLFRCSKESYKSVTQYNDTIYVAKCPECGGHSLEMTQK